MKDITEIIVEYGLNERFDQIVLNDSEYQKLDSEITKMHESISQMDFSKEQKEWLNDILCLMDENYSRYAELAYKLGLFDCSEILRFLHII